ncbi:thioredoxin-dependent thiol peroxidase [Clostridium sp. JNZ J1-5]
MNNLEIKEGTIAPDFSLIGSDDKQHKLSDYKGKKVILYFYPKDNTPGCTREAESFRDNIDSFNALNTIVLGVSRDSLTSHDKFISKLNLPFVLLSDSDEKVVNLYGVLKEKTMFGKTSMGIERSTFIIDEDGIIEKIYRKVKVNGHVEDILKHINK